MVKRFLYKFKVTLMKAFPNNGSLSSQQKMFNYRLSKARVVVEHAYGRLKGRRRCLLKRNDVLIRDVPKLVAACCVLHNICEIHGESFDENWMKDVADLTSASCNSTASASLDSSGQDVRQAMMTYFDQ